jgi:hypothetical protein
MIVNSPFLIAHCTSVITSGESTLCCHPQSKTHDRFFRRIMSESCILSLLSLCDRGDLGEGEEGMASVGREKRKVRPPPRKSSSGRHDGLRS